MSPEFVPTIHITNAFRMHIKISLICYISSSVISDEHEKNLRNQTRIYVQKLLAQLLLFINNTIYIIDNILCYHLMGVLANDCHRKWFKSGYC